MCLPRTNNLCTFSNAIYALTLLWALIVIFTAGGKLVEFEPSSFVKHFTNWNFLFAGIFYLLVLPFRQPHHDDSIVDVRCSGCIMAWCFFPLYLNTWFVFTVVTLLLAEDPEFITDLFEVFGANIVMLGDAYFHFVPLLAIVIFTAFFHNTIFYGVNRQCVCCARTCGSVGTCLYGTYLFIAGSMLMIGAYNLVLLAMGETAVGSGDNSVYGSDISPAYIFLILLGLAIIFNGSYLIVLDRCHRVREPSKHPRYDEARAMLKTDAELFGERREEYDLMLDKQLDAVATSAMLEVSVDDLRSVEAMLEKVDESRPVRAFVPGPTRPLGPLNLEF